MTPLYESPNKRAARERRDAIKAREREIAKDLRQMATAGRDSAGHVVLLPSEVRAYAARLDPEGADQ